MGVFAPNYRNIEASNFDHIIISYLRWFCNFADTTLIDNLKSNEKNNNKNLYILIAACHGWRDACAGQQVATGC